MEWMGGERLGRKESQKTVWNILYEKIMKKGRREGRKEGRKEGRGGREEEEARK